MVKNGLRLVLFFLLLTTQAFAQALPKGITLLHFSDLHGHLENFPRLISLAQQIRKANEQQGFTTLLLCSGDLFTGTPLSSEWQGALEIDAMNQLQLDLMVAGNHEFDFTLERLLALQKKMNFPIISANIYYAHSPKPLFEPSHILSLGGLSIGVLGLTTPKTPVMTHPDNVRDLTFLDPSLATEKSLSTLASSDFQIALTHMETSFDTQVLKKFKKIDLILGGHVHPNPKEESYCRKVSHRTLCVSPANGRWLGRIDLERQKGVWKVAATNLLPVDETLPEDRAAKQWLSQYENIIKRKYSQIIAYAKEDLPHDRSQATPLGRLIAEMLREYTQADVALINSGGIRYPLKKGPIRKSDIMTILPFPNMPVVVELTGKELKEIIHYSFKNRNSGAFLQIAGLEVDDKAKKPKIYFQGKQLRANDKFSVVTIDFLVAGGDGYVHFKDKKVLRAYSKILAEVFAEYLHKQGKVGVPN